MPKRLQSQIQELMHWFVSWPHTIQFTTMEKITHAVMTVAAEDYCADTNVLRTPSRLELLYARQSVVVAAVAHGIQAIDLVCVDYKNGKVLEEECVEGRQFGFTGKQAIHPSQIEMIHKVFSPSKLEIEKASRVLEGYKAHSELGKGAFSLDGKMIDMPVVKAAQKMLDRARFCGLA